MQNEILADVKLVDQKGSTKATAEVTIGTDFGDLTILRVRIIHQEGKDPWVTLPDISFKDTSSGEYRHISIIIPSRRLEREIFNLVLDKYGKLLTDATPF